jgi:hypothetical protein
VLKATKCQITKAQRAEYDRLSKVHASFERTTQQLASVMTQRSSMKVSA